MTRGGLGTSKSKPEVECQDGGRLFTETGNKNGAYLRCGLRYLIEISYGNKFQPQRAKTANVISQHSDILAMCCTNNIIFCDVSCFSSASLLMWSLKSVLNWSVFRLSDVSREGLKFCRWTFFFSFFFLFLSIHRTQQPRSGWPSNVFRRFGRR